MNKRIIVTTSLVACAISVQAQVLCTQADLDQKGRQGGAQVTVPTLWNQMAATGLSALAANTGHAWIGYNQAVGTDTTVVVDRYGNYQTFGGMVGFDLPFETCDTLYCHKKMSPYGYLKGNTFYAYCPNYSNSTGTYTSMDYMGWDIRNWQITDSVRVRISNGTSDIPYVGCYDPVSGLEYAITFGKENGVETYYSYIVDPKTHKIKRLAKLGTYDSAENFTAYKCMFTDDENIYAMDGNNVMQIDRLTGEATLVGHFEFERTPYSIQAIRYDNGVFIYDHFDLYTGTTFWKFSLDNIGPDGVIAMESLGALPTGWDHIFRAPSAEMCEAEILANVSDLKVNVTDAENAVITCTVPTVTQSGRTLDTATLATVTVRVDGKEVAIEGGQQWNLGTALSIPVTGLAPTCLHYASVQVEPQHVWSVVESFELLGNSNQGTTFCAGKDAPGQVSDIKVIINSDKNAVKVSWKAPTSARYSAFGASFDKNAVTYTVLRTLTGDTLATGLTTTSLIDSIPAYMTTQQYTIVPMTEGVEGTRAESSRYIFGSYVELPYSNDFESQYSLEYFTVLNVNNDGTSRTWQWNNYYHDLWISYPNGGVYNDDWLITPAFQADSEHVYRFAFRATAEGSQQNLVVTLGNGKTVRSQTHLLADMQGWKSSEDGSELQFYARMETEGTYYFGIHDYSEGEDATTRIDDLRIEEAFSTHAPDSVTEVVFQPSDRGVLSGTLFFTLPERDVLGNALQSLTKYEVYRNDTLVSVVEDAQLGSAEEVVVAACHGFNTYRIVAYNEYGNGWPIDVRAYVGADVPVSVGEIVAVWAESTQARRSGVTLSWEAPAEGVHGGYIDPNALTYNVYHYDADKKTYSLIDTGVSGTSYTTSELTGNKQDYYAYAVSAVSSEGEGDKARKGITLGAGYKLPFSESWYYGGQNGPWITTPLAGNPGWAIDNNIFNLKVPAVDGDAFQLLLRNLGDTPVEARIASPIINLTSAVHPVMGIWIYHDLGASSGSWLCLEATEDGYHFTDITEHDTFSGNAGWTFHVFSLDAVKGKNVQIAVKVSMPETESRFFTDAFSIVDLQSGNNLAVTGIGYNPDVVAGNETEVSVRVLNLAATEATEYEVCLFANGEMVGDELVEEPLSIGATRSFSFPVALTSLQTEGVECYAEVIYDDDNAADNVSDTLTITTQPIQLNAVEDLTVAEGKLAWSAPAEMQGMRVIEDFEDGIAFSIKGYHDWTCYDGDGQLHSGYMQYYNNYWPNYNNPQAWMVWSLEETGTLNVVWPPIDGEKCLISWMVTGQYPDQTTAQGSNDDWFISPEVVGGTELSFDAKAPACNHYGPSTLQVLYSTTDREIGSFELLEEYSIGEAMVEETESHTLTLPADARYVAFRNTNTEFGLMLDNIAYTKAVTPVLQGYNVYCGFARQNTSLVSDLQYQPARLGTYTVTARYDLGESQPSNSVAIETLGIESVSADADARQYWSLDGRKYLGVPANGIVLMRQGGTVSKAIVR